MKRISFFLAMALVAIPVFVRAQDAATEERLNRLTALVQDLTESRDAQAKRIAELTRAVEALQQQLNKPNANYATAEDVKHLADKLQEVDRTRREDDEKILQGVEKAVKTLGSRPSPPAAPSVSSGTSDKGFEYVVQQGDTLSVIVAAYRDKNIKVTVEQILKANPGLVPEKMRLGQKIFIPAPQ
jgi:LysM repeat protein